MQLMTSLSSEGVPEYYATSYVGHISGSDWVFEYDKAQDPLASSERKHVYRGTFIYRPDSKHPRRTPARALEFAEGFESFFGNECASLAAANALGVGPEIIKITQKRSLGYDPDGDNSFGSVMAMIIEEDAGISLHEAIFDGALVPGLAPSPLSPIGTPERARENAKIKFDVFSQLHNLHRSGLYHRDLRAPNVCVRRFGDKPEDIRATIIDFELISDITKSHLEAVAAGYKNAVFKGKEYLLPVEIDLGYLAALCFELDTGKSVVKDADEAFYTGEMYPFFALRPDGTVSVQRITQQDLDILAQEATLLPINEEGISRLLGKKLGRRLDFISGCSDIIDCANSLIRHGGYLDAKDIMTLEDSPDYLILINLEVIAVASYDTYMAQKRARGEEPKYDDFYKQPLEVIETGLGNIRSYWDKAARFGYRIVRADDPSASEPIEAFNDEEFEALSEMEHDRWMAQKKAQGWVYGEIRDDSKKIHNCLVPYAKLPKYEKDKDRRNVRNMIPFLRDYAGLIVCR